MKQLQIIDHGRELTCGELYEAALRLAGYFDAVGLKPGDVVSFQLPNWWEANVINLAAAMIGVVVDPIVPINRDAEVSHMLNASGTKVMFVPEVFRKFDYPAMLARILSAVSIRNPNCLCRRHAVSRRGRLLKWLASQWLRRSTSANQLDTSKNRLFTA